MKSILIVDDEKEICETVKMILEYEDYHVDYSTVIKEALDKIGSSSYDAIILDIKMPDMNGFEVLNWIKEKNIDISVIMLSAFGNLENAVKATKLGAFDFIEKPPDRDKLIISVRNAVGQTNLRKENKQLKKDLIISHTIIGESEAIKNILATVSTVAKTEARVMITGENGTGKELVAIALHKESGRAIHELVEVNCAAIPNELIESELFGHEKGSFTGAMQQRIGKFEKAHLGTLFLDEIGDMSLQAQAKVLRAIEEGKIERVGGNKKIDVDVRIIAATNKDLQNQIKEGNFREDLYHRLNVIPIHIPPLRERRIDIPILTEHFIKEICEKNKFPIKKFTEGALTTLQNMEWTGNVRELRNLIERLVIMIPRDVIGEEDIINLIPGKSEKSNDILDIANSFQEFKEKAEKTFIQKQLSANNWNISKTAEILEIQRSHLYSKIKKYELDKDKK